MAFLDNFDKKLTMFGQNAIQKTKEMTDSAKISSSLRNVESQKGELFMCLGELYFKECEKSSGELDETARELIETLRELEKKESQLQEDLRNVKGMISCPECGTEISISSQFCSVCGAKIERENIEKKETEIEKKCRNCGAVIESGQAFCVKCGIKIDEPDKQGD